MAETATYSPGLEGVIAGETALSTVSEGLSYRGYLVTQLAEHCSFDEVAYLLLHGDLPTQSQLDDFEKRVRAARKIPAPLVELLKTLPSDTPPMDALRTSVSVLSHFETDLDDRSPEGILARAERLYGQIPLAVAAFARLSHSSSVIEPRDDLSHAAHFLYLLRGEEPNKDDARALDVSLTLYAEHEFNASTFTARVICSTESDLHSSIVGAIGALKGRLHGGANEKVMDVLREAGGPDTAEAWVRNAIANKVRVMGFGHRVYKSGDVRARILKEYARKAAEANDQMKWEETAEIIEKIIGDEKKLFPNLDWPAGRLYHSMDLDVGLYTPIFVMSRVTGWSAHFAEQAANNRLIRPRGRYTGPETRDVVPIAERG